MSGVEAATNRMKSLEVGGTERTRQLRTPHTPAEYSYAPIKEFAKRPPRNDTQLHEIDLEVNWYRLKINKDHTIYVYELMIEEERRDKGRKIWVEIKNRITIAKIFWAIKRSYKYDFAHPLIFDDLKYMFTQFILNFDGVRTYNGWHPEKRAKVRVMIKPHFYFNISRNGRTNNEEGWTYYLNHLISQKSRWVPPREADREQIEFSQRFFRVGGGMFLIPRSPDIPTVPSSDQLNQDNLMKKVFPGMQFWVGLHATVRRMEDESPVFLFGLTNKLFIELNLNLLDFYTALTGDQPPTDRSCLTDEAADDFDSKFRGVKLRCPSFTVTDRDGFVVECKERHSLRFVKIAREEFPSNYEICVKDNRMSGKVLIKDWYHDKGKRLKHPNMQLCIVKEKKEFKIPMELLITHDEPQRYTQLLSYHARTRIGTLLARPPREYKNYIESILEKLGYTQDPFQKDMNVSLETKMVECKGHVLTPCKVMAKDESGMKIVLERKPTTGEFIIQRPFISTKKIVRFVVYNMTKVGERFAVRKEEALEFYRGLVRKCVSQGLIVTKPEQLEPAIYRPEPHDIDLMSGDLLQKSMEDDQTLFERNPEAAESGRLVFLIFQRGGNELLYGKIKVWSEVYKGLVTQVVTDTTVKAACTTSLDETPSDRKSIYHGIFLKLNAKLGGINQITEIENSGRSEGVTSHAETMFIGIDVIHPSPNGVLTDCSIAAIQVSMDEYATKYKSKVVVNPRCNETVQLFSEKFAHLLSSYNTNRGSFPRRIVILRDGVSDSEMLKVASIEIHAIKTAFDIATSGLTPPPSSPLFTYIVVQKNHRTRFFHRNGNPLMGTVVDRVAVHPWKYDFYAIFHHAPLGTAKPIHFTVVLDQSNSSQDEIHEMLFRLCHLNARCSKPISIPVPVRYAHLKCKRAAIWYRELLRNNQLHKIMDKQQGEDDDAYKNRAKLDAMKIEEELQRHRSAPDMHFV